MSTAVDGQSDSNSDNSGVLAKAFNWTKALELTKALDWLWDSVLSGSKFISGSPITATPTMTPEEIGVLVDSIIRNHAMMAAGTGFLTNIGGLITLPVAIPANLAGVYAIQMRMMQEICRARGVDPKEPFMRIVARVSLVGNGALELLE